LVFLRTRATVREVNHERNVCAVIFKTGVNEGNVCAVIFKTGVNEGTIKRQLTSFVTQGLFYYQYW
jgi:hypothetical protein